MKKYEELAKNLVTTGEARKITGLASRSTIDYHCSQGHVRYIWIDEGKPTAIRLLLLEDVEKLKGKG